MTNFCEIVFQLLILCVVRSTCDQEENQSPVYHTTKGQVRGIRENVLGKDIDVFLGIPYAKPPVGDLRFRHPVPNDDWVGIYDATQKPNACWQGLEEVFPELPAAMEWSANTPRSEDCLYLNVWVPSERPNGPLPVMVWIYGGGFYSGSSALDVYDAKYIAAESDVIVVSMQYRIGALGFLALDHWSAPKNTGLFDQLMAIEWVEQNIQHFGGDDQSVTLFGESAGAASVGMHMVSPKSRGKFHRAILQSGGPSADWAVLSPGEARSRSVTLAKNLGCVGNNDEELVECLRATNASDFPNREWETIEYGVVRFPFAPTVDGVFLTEEPEKTLKKGDFKRCPVLLGHNTNEASYWLLYYDQNLFPVDSEPNIYRSTFNSIIDNLFHYHPYYPKQLNGFGKEAIKFHYRHWKNPDDVVTNTWQLDMAVGDFHFVCPTVNFAQHIASTNNNVFYYVFEHRSSMNPWPKWMGVLHGDEIFYVFGRPLNDSNAFDEVDRNVSRKTMQYWTNFAKTGDPNKGLDNSDLGEWPKFDTKTRKHLIIRGDLIDNNGDIDKNNSIGRASRASQCAFWTEYMPSLITKTANMSQLEIEWKMKFDEWSSEYVREWRNQFEHFLLQNDKKVKDAEGSDP